MVELQGTAFQADDDYERGSPHLLHRALTSEIVGTVRAAVLDRLAARGTCRVLEVGAGHGSFTDHVAALGAQVTITEMSAWSQEVLARRYEHNDAVTLVRDSDGEAVFELSDRYDVVLCISVLHHIPDYLDYLQRVLGRIETGGAFISFQDPPFYPRRSQLSVKTDRVAFLLWRIGQGDFKRGLATQLRRFSGRYDENEPGDMVEYHVVRQGVDELAITELLERHFADVTLRSYWSTPSHLLQRIGTKLASPNTFAVVACGRLDRADDVR